MIALIFILFSQPIFAQPPSVNSQVENLRNDVIQLNLKLNQLVDQMNVIFKYPPPTSFDGKSTWTRTDPDLVKRLERIEKQNKKILKHFPECTTTYEGNAVKTVCP